MISFEDVLTVLRDKCEEYDPEHSLLSRLFVVHDARGRVRLCVEPKDQPATVDPPRLEDLEQSLIEALGKYFDPPLLFPKRRDEWGRLATTLLRKHKDLQFKPWPAADGTPGRWFKLERRLSKVEWLDDMNPAPPWPLVAGAPTIVAFYSFKGGVGRTTALLSCAWQLAAQGKQVALVDLDLEAPGLAALCCRNNNDEVKRGVLDYLVDHSATGEADIEGLGVPASALVADDNRSVEDNIFVYPAGRLSRSYVEKLARLDFLASDDHPSTSPAASALRNFLERIKKPTRGTPPDYIFIDSRAGLHDLAGLSLHGLAHLDVLVGRASQQSYQGLDLTVEMLVHRRRQDLRQGKRLHCMVVHGMAPSTVSDPTGSEKRRFRDKTYEIFQKHIYSKMDSAPLLTSTGAPHFPVVLHSIENLQRFQEIRDVRHELFGSDYEKLLDVLKERLDEQLKPPNDTTQGDP